MSHDPMEKQKLIEFLEGQGDRLLLAEDGAPPKPSRDFLPKEAAESLHAKMQEQERGLIMQGPPDPEEPAEKEDQEDTFSKGDKKLSRKQRRHQERLSDELNITLKNFVLRYFMEKGKIFESELGNGPVKPDAMARVAERRDAMLASLDKDWRTWLRNNRVKYKVEVCNPFFLQQVVKSEKIAMENAILRERHHHAVKESGKNFANPESPVTLAIDEQDQPQQMEVASEDTGQEGEVAAMPGGADQGDEGGRQVQLS